MNIFLKIGEIIFKIIGSILILIVLILERLAKNSQESKKEKFSNERYRKTSFKKTKTTTFLL